MNKKNRKIDEFWMQHAINLAYLGQSKGEVPVGAILVLKNKIIGQGFNTSICQKDPTAHAEIVALRNGAKKINNYRLLNTTLYVTLEPCIMCCGAIINSRINRLVFGSSNYRDNNNIFVKKNINFFFTKYKIIIKKNLLEKKCSKLIKKFFKIKR
ncbi:tRNA-specific adenosine deaminase [Buchnera aphidicola (Thelaxes suberi)]|uniref:tRNA adenosine(34) deaminase TadA n=1 Tax=Buchnera aphidicola TaxID=9 RepID=UPI003464DD72